MDAPYEELAAVPEETLRDGMAMWSGIDAPWLGMVDKQKFGRLLADIERQLEYYVTGRYASFDHNAMA